MLTILILCFAFFVFPLIQVFLSSGEGGRTISELLSRILLQRNGDKIDNFAVIISSIDKHGYLWGGTILGFLSSLVPALDNMSAPTIHETRLFVYLFFPDIFERGVGYPVPLVANGYWNFGILGSGIFLYFAGLFYGAFFRYAEQNKGLAAVIYAAFCFSMYEVVFGSLANGIARNVMVALVALFLAWVLSGGRAYRAR